MSTTGAEVISITKDEVETSGYVGAITRELFEFNRKEELEEARERIQKTCFVLFKKGLMHVDRPISFRYEYGYGHHIVSTEVYFAIGILRKKGYLHFSEAVDNADKGVVGDEVKIVDETPVFKNSANLKKVKSIVELLHYMPINQIRLLASLIYHDDEDKVYQYNPMFDNDEIREGMRGIIQDIDDIVNGKSSSKSESKE